MANYSISKTVGQNEFQILEGTAAPGTGDIELRINLANLPLGYDNVTIIQALDEFKNWVTGHSQKVV